MKRLIPAALILIIVLLLNRFSDNFIRNSCTGAVNLVEQCEEEWNAGNNYKETLEQLLKYWDKKEYGLSFFVNHEKLSDVELQIKNLFYEKKTEEKAVFHEHIETLKTLLEQIWDDTKLNFKSIV